MTTTPATPLTQAQAVAEPVPGAVWYENSVSLIQRGREDDFCERKGASRIYFATRPAEPAPVVEAAGDWQAVLELAKDYARLIRDEAWGSSGIAFDKLRTAVRALAAQALPAAAPVAKTGLATVPWPVVDAYAGGADAGGVASWLKVRLGDGPETTEFIRKDLIGAPVAGEAESYPDSALGFILEALEANHLWHQDYDDHGGYMDSELEARNVQAIATVRAAVKTASERAQVTQAAVGALERFNATEGVGELDAIERLRFFCSLSMRGQDWLDVEPFFDALSKPPIAAPAGDDRSRASEADTRRLDWLDSQREAYGFADVHEGNVWEIRGAYGSIRQAIDHESFTFSTTTSEGAKP